ncbi:antiviral reverse transcriptase Drt3b [Pseudomonas sp. URMO17WK12:I4]|uniref:antiviral reverse transcriptase Drt3b n=1 Tax=Pseudomonas sp. URMO17WK12:I4 TaxID=1283292 RepID=UPI0004AD61A3|nr:antiviral reverse transcriptase Drt3b [Pseudomonas sp. URMO17WK12:I4]
MPKENSKRIRKSDYCRVLVTETAPYETPLIFSNDGFYNISKQLNSGNKLADAIAAKLIVGKGNNQNTVPYQFKIRKNANEFRRLSVLHPLAQWQMKLFYEKYEQLICHYCGIGNYSIRAPLRTASIFYYKNSWENIGKYKRGTVDNIESENKHKHSSSFYSYKGYTRLYKFFNSATFISLEKKFPALKTLDVSKCFDSIYTHSIAWATKDKQFVKDGRFKSSIFGNQFDELIRMANHNETNGIVIGPEISRIFAEIIFQDIDHQVEKKLSSASYNLLLDVDYSIKRYVDDIFIFAKTIELANKIFEIYADHLSTYKLHVNSGKSQTYERPFFTPKSKVIRTVNLYVNEFAERFLEEIDDGASLKPKRIFKIDRLIRSFVDSIKATCTTEKVDYDEVSSYIISALFERTKRLVNIQGELNSGNSLDEYRDAAIVFLEVMTFFYSVAPSVSASYKFCASIILLCRFSDAHLGHYKHTIKQKAFDLALSLLESDTIHKRADVENFISLEVINVILSLSDFGDAHLLPPTIVDKVFRKDSTYFNIVSCLFYIKDYQQYSSIREATLKKIDFKIQDLSNIQSNTEQACLLLDSLTCPYIDHKRKSKYIQRACSALSIPKPNAQEIRDFLSTYASEYWFINWHEVDLLNALERKELRQVY